MGKNLPDLVFPLHLHLGVLAMNLMLYLLRGQSAYLKSGFIHGTTSIYNINRSFFGPSYSRNTKNEDMRESNEIILEKANAAIAKGDYEGFLSHCTEDTLWIFVGERTLEGKDAVREYMAAVYTEPPKFAVERLINEGDFVVAIGTINLKNEKGETTAYSYCDVWRFRDGKMAELKAFVVENH